MKSANLIPNYYSYLLRVGGKNLSNIQKEYFFNCVNKIYKNNDKFIYRGDKKEKLYSIYGLKHIYNDDNNFQDKLFVLGAKATMFLTNDIPGLNQIDIDQADNNVFSYIFRMLSNLLQRTSAFGSIGRSMYHFRKKEETLNDFFCKSSNESIFITNTNKLNSKEQIIVRDYYLALLHHVSKSEYYSSSFLLSTTTNFSQAYKFAWRREDTDSQNPLIIFGWIPNQYEGILSVPDSRILKTKVDMEAYNLPVYEKSFFPFQQEITLKGGLLPHYLLGYLHRNGADEIFEINPTLFQTDDLWDGIELPVDQRNFNQRIQNTLFGRYFSIECNNAENTNDVIYRTLKNKKT